MRYLKNIFKWLLFFPLYKLERGIIVISKDKKIEKQDPHQGFPHKGNPTLEILTEIRDSLKRLELQGVTQMAITQDIQGILTRLEIAVTAIAAQGQGVINATDAAAILAELTTAVVALEALVTPVP